MKSSKLIRQIKSTKTKKSKKFYVITAIAFALVGALVYGLSHADTVNNFVDISSPQCGNNAIIGARNFYGIVGLNGTSLDFGTNNCVVEQTQLFKSYDLYVGTNYPSSKCSGISAYDCGSKAALHNISLIKFLNLHPLRIWIDVETGPKIPWSTNKSENNAFLLGLYNGMSKETGIVGYYSNQSMWNSITGGANLGSNGNWYATGRTNAGDALSYCNLQFGGVYNKYVQYVENGNLDVNWECPTNGKNSAPTPSTTPGK